MGAIAMYRIIELHRATEQYNHIYIDIWLYGEQ